MKKYFIFSILIFLVLPFVGNAQDAAEAPSSEMILSEDELAVRGAILDYVEALYLVDSSRIHQSVHPSLRKIGYWYDDKSKAYHDNLEMTHDELVKLASVWNAGGKRVGPDGVKEITVFEVNDKTAIAKLKAHWGIDYFQLAKTSGKWYIMNVMWQSVIADEKPD